MALFNSLKHPVFLKDTSDLTTHIEMLKSLLEEKSSQFDDEIRRDLKLTSWGLSGEENVAFELKHCDMPFYVIRDLFIDCEDVSAQIDFAVVTRKFTLFIECKNLIGNIEIDRHGNFIRSYSYNRQKVREGIYSPITQNQRHLEVMRRLFISKQSNKIMAFAADKMFDKMYKSVVVLSNPKTVLNDRYAPKEIKSQVIRADQVGNYIKQVYKDSKESAVNDKDLLKFAENLLNNHKPNKTDYLKKYRKPIETNVGLTSRTSYTKQVGEASFKEDEIIDALKAFRLQKSRQDNIKPYYIFNNKQMSDLIKFLPSNKEELLQINGFGMTKVEKYGNEILNIIDEFKI